MPRSLELCIRPARPIPYLPAEYEELAGDYGFELVTKGITATADVALAADDLLSEVDCITNLTDNTVVASLPTILEKANDKKVPVFGARSSR